MAFFFPQKFWNSYGFAELLLISILNTLMPAVVTQVNEISETSLLYTSCKSDPEEIWSLFKESVMQIYADDCH